MADIAAVTSIEITARDLTRGAIDSVRGGFNELRNAAGSLQGALAGIGASLSLAAFSAAIKGAIDYADQLNDLAKKTGIAVETLGGLGYAAAQTGTSLEAIAKGSAKLASLMAEAEAGGKKANAVFDAMQVSAQNAGGGLKSIDQMLFEVADKFEGYQDGAEKAALANQVFGEKMGAQLIPLLDEGGAKLRELVGEWQAYGGVSAETAARADAFNDTLAKIQMMGGALWRTIASALLPTLQTLANIFVDAKSKAGDFSGVAEGVTVIVKGLAVGALAAVEAFRAVGTSIGTVVGAIVAYLRGDSLSSIWEGVKQGFGDVASSVASAWDNMGKVVNASTATVASSINTNLGAKSRAPIVALGEAAEKTKKVIDQLTAEEKEYLALMKELADAEAKRVQAMDQQQASLVEQLARLQQEGEEIGLTKRQLNELTLARLDAKIATLAQAAASRESVAGMDAETAAMYAQLQVLKQIRDQTASNQTNQAIVDQANAAQEAWQRAADSIGQSLTDALLRGFESGADMAKNFRDTLVNMFKTLVLRPIIQAIVMPLAGGFAGLFPGAANAAGAGGVGGDLFSLLSSGSSLFGGGSSLFGTAGISGLFSGAGGIFGAGAIGNSFALSGVGQALGLSAAGLDAAGGLALTGLGTALGTAIPILGAALAIAAMAGAFDKDPSQVIGTFGIKPGASGFEDNAYTSSRFGNVGFLDDGTQYFGGQAAQVFNQVIAQTLDAIGSRLNDNQNATLAQRLQGMNFGTFEGEYTTEDFIKKYGAEILGKVISAGLEQLDPKLQAVFDAFHGTADEMAKFANVLLTVHDLTKDLPIDFRDSLIAALDGTEEMSAKVIALAGAYATLQEAMNANPLEDALAAVAASTDSAYAALGKMANAFEDLINAFDGSEDASKKIAQATVDYYNALVKVIAGIEQLRGSIADMFDNTIRDFTLQTLDDPGKKKWYQEQIASLYGQLQVATDPADIDRITKLINEYMRAAFGLLTPDEQRSQLQGYIDFANQVQQLADQRLAQAEADAQARADQLFNQLRDTLTGAANDMAGAGKDMKAGGALLKEAAASIAASANTPININITQPLVNA